MSQPKSSNLSQSKGSERISLFRWVWRSYLRTALVPLLLVEFVLVAAYLIANTMATQRNLASIREVADAELQRIAHREAVLIHGQLEHVSNHTELFRRATRRALDTPYEPSAEELARYEMTADGVFYTARDGGNAAAYYSGFVPVREEQKTKALQLSQLDPLMKNIKETNELVAQIYLNTYDSYSRLYPYFPVLEVFPPKLDTPTFNFYYEADEKHNPEKRVVWTDVYVDPAGQGWMASSIAPVYRDDKLEAVVGLDITVATITQRILHLEIPWNGYGMLLGADGTILAMPPKAEQDLGLQELTSYAYSDYVKQDTYKPEEFNVFRRQDLKPLAAALKKKESGKLAFNLKEMQRASWATVGETGWRLLVMVPQAQIYAQANALSRQLMHIGAIMVVGILLFYVGFFFVLFRRARRMAASISAPLETIDAIVDRIGHGEYEQTPPDFAVKELQASAAGVVSTGLRLKEVTQTLVDAQKEAEQARDEALEASRLKSEFLASVSHELRTPMAITLGLIDVLEETPLAEEQRKFLGKMRSSGQSLLSLINDMLDFSRIEAGKMRLNRGPVDPAAIVEDVTELMAPQAHAKGLEINSHVSSSAPSSLVGDDGRLRQVILNLLNNAVKFTDYGSVMVRLDSEEVSESRFRLRFSITDTGIGISEAGRKRLFRPFTQVDGSSTRRHGGTGLGLSICKRLVELMGGEIGLESQEGVGSTFWFSVILESGSRAVREVPRRRLAGTQILLVDPNSGVRDALRDYLESEGARVVAAESAGGFSGTEADVVLLGESPESLEESAALQAIKADSRLCAVPRILLASREHRGLAECARRAGFARHLIKPVRRVQLIEVILGAVEAEPSQRMHPHSSDRPKM